MGFYLSKLYDNNTFFQIQNYYHIYHCLSIFEIIGDTICDFDTDDSNDLSKAFGSFWSISITGSKLLIQLLTLTAY